MTRSNIKAMATAILALVSVSASATIEFDLGYLLNGDKPGSTAPYLIAEFTTVGSGGQVTLTLTSSLEVSTEFVSAFAFNIDPKFTPNNVGVTLPSGYTMANTDQTVPGVGPDGKGWDFLITEKGHNLKGSTIATFTLTAPGLTEDSFKFKNNGSGGSNSRYVAAHVQGISGSKSGAISITGEPIIKGVTIGDLVWKDANGNGVQDSGEPGISGVTLTLTGTSAAGIAVNATTTTDANGRYSFSEPPGTYTVAASAPSGYTATATGKGTTATDSNPSPSGTSPGALSLGGSDLTLDFGFYQPVTIGNFVWKDLNGNGVQDTGEPGIAGVTLTLTGTSAAGIAVNATTTTDANGHYSFSAAPGTYTVTVSAPAGYTATATAKGTTATDSNASPSATTPGTLTSGGSDSTLDFGFYQPATIGDFVWKDLNGNGVQDTGEPGIAGVTLTLSGTSAAGIAVNATTTTDANGHYSFSAPPGTYTVTVSAPAGYTATATGKGTTATDSNASSSGTTPCPLTSGGSDLTLDFGFYQSVTIGDFVWKDLNGNGVQDTGEPGIAGVTLTLSGMSAAGIAVNATTTTDANGHYAFSEPPGTYTVAASAPSGYTATATGKGTTATDSNASPSGTTPAALASGGSDLNLDFGFYQPVKIGDFVWKDGNGNGVQDTGEPGISGVTLTLSGTSAAGTAVNATTTTDTNGRYSFSEPPGTYTVAASAPSGYTATATGKGTTATDSNPSPGATTPGALTSGGSDLTLDFGFYQPITIGNFVWKDLNGNGVQNSSEPGIAGVTLTLSGTSAAGDTVSATTTTDANGRYSFSAPPGTYKVTVSVPSGYTATATGKGTSTTDSNPSPSATTPGTLTSGGSDLTLDFGLYQSVTIGDFVWKDLNANGVQDSGEPGLAGVTLTLAGTSTAGNTVNATTTTDANGHYSFSAPPGTYTVAVSTPSGYTATATGKGTTATDSNSSPSGTTPSALTSGGSDLTLDFGFYQPVTLGDFVWKDVNGNGVQDASEPGISGVTLTLSGKSSAGKSINATTTTDANGHYSFSEPPGTYTVTVSTPSGYTATATGKGTTATDSNASPSATTPSALTSGDSDLTLDFGFFQPVTIGDFVWKDVNYNGVQDSGESGISGVKLTLTGTSAAGNAVSATTTSSSNGRYSFSAPPGTYTVVASAPSGYTATATGKGTTATDSNPSPSATTPGALTSGGSDLTLDFGFFQPVTIGDFVWNDLNLNGAQDAGEPGIAGVALTLSGTSAAGGAASATATTDANGRYAFAVPPGTYTVAASAPSGYTATATGKGTTATDSNPSPSATTPGTLTAGGSDLTLDFGFYQPVSIGDFVWQDVNGNGVQDAGEPGLAGVTLTLIGTSAAGKSINATTTTDANGHYSFSAPSGAYTVTVSAPAGYTATATGKGTTATDSNSSPSATTPGTLTAGASDLNLDFGFYQPAPTLALLKSIRAYPSNGAVVVEWQTASEVDSLAFDLYRQVSSGGAAPRVVQWRRVNAQPVLALDAITGAAYHVVDATATIPGTYTYRLVEWNTKGIQSDVGVYHLAVSAQPAFTAMQRLDGQVLVKWQGGTPPYRLEQRGQLAGDDQWTEVPLADPNSTTIVLPMNQTSGFYRISNAQ